MTDTEMLTMILKNIQSMQGDMRNMKESIEAMQYTIQGLQNDMHDMQVDIQSIKGDIFNMQKDIADSQSDINDLNEDIRKTTFTLESTINRCLTVLGTGYRTTSEKIDKLNIDTIIAENNVSKMEIELIKSQLDILSEKINRTA